MPVLPTYDGPQIKQAAIPDFRENLQTDAAMFGGDSGKVMVQAGSQLDKLGGELAGHAYRIKEQDDRTAVKAALNQYDTIVRGALYGDGKETGYYGLQGAAAIAKHGDVATGLEAARAKILEGITDERQRRLFEDTSRQHYTNSLDGMARHREQARQVNADSVSKMTIDNAAANAVTGYSEPAFAGMVLQGKAEIESMFKRRGISAPEIDENGKPRPGTNALLTHEIRTYESGIHKAVIHRLISEGKLGEAEAWNAKHGGLLYGNDTAIVGDWMRTKTDAAKAQAEVDRIVRGASAPAGASSIADAIRKQEYRGTGQSPDSVDGAVGNWQIMPDTFSRYAKPGEDIRNPDHNDAVGRRIVDDLSKKYNGDAARVAVAYFSGEGNVAPAGSPTPWKTDRKDGNGKSVSSYVADVTGRLGPLPTQPQPVNPDMMRPAPLDTYVGQIDRTLPQPQQDDARRRLAEWHTTQERSWADRVAAVKQAAISHVEKDGNSLDNMDPALVSRAKDAGIWNDVVAHHKQRVEQSYPPRNGQDFTVLLGKSYTDQNEFIRTINPAVRPVNIHPDDWNTLVRRRGEIFQRDDKGVALTSALAIAKNRLDPITRTMSKNDKEAFEAEFQGALAVELERMTKGADGKPVSVPTSTELDAMIGRMLMKGAVKGTGVEVGPFRIGEKDAYQFQAKRDQKDFIVQHDDIPEPFRKKAEAAFKSAGASYDRKVVEEEYTAYRMKGGI